MTRILGIETSCDETAVGLVEDGKTVLSNAVASSLALHAPYGGVIPEIAARLHVESLWQVLSQSLDDAHTTLQEVDALAVTYGPGLPGALLIGVAFAKGLALALERPLIPVDHLAAHLYAGEMSEPSLQPPYVGLIVSGGHTVLCVVHEDGRYEFLGETKDDAVGEAFDKVAKMLGLGYPGGPVIDRLAVQGKPDAVAFPRGTARQPFDFSFSGLKTAVAQHVNRLRKAAPAELAGDPSSAPAAGQAVLPPATTADIAASFQEAAVDILVQKTLKACQRTGLTKIVVGGGVAANTRLRAKLGDLIGSRKFQVVFPPPELCVDNGAMVAGVAFPLLKRGRVADLRLQADPNLSLAGVP